VVAFWRSHALASFRRVLLRGRLLLELRPALRLGCAGAHISDPVRLAPVPRAVVVARERPVWARQPRRRLRAALARPTLRSAERRARGRLRARPRRVVADDYRLAGAPAKSGQSELMTTSFTHDTRSLAETYDRVSDLQFDGGKRLVERLGLEEGAHVLDVGC